jgi:hypothetical protein
VSEDFDPNRIRDVEIRRLGELAALAYRNAMDEGLRMRTRESWYQKYTNAVLALNQLLKDLQYKDYEKRLKVIEDSRRLRRTVLSGADARKWLALVTRKNRQRKKPSRSPIRGRIG